MFSKVGDDIHLLNMEDDHIFNKLKITLLFFIQWKTTFNIKNQKPNLIQIMQFKEQPSYFSQPDQHIDQKVLAQLRKQKPNQPELAVT